MASPKKARNRVSQFCHPFRSEARPGGFAPAFAGSPSVAWHAYASCFKIAEIRTAPSAGGEAVESRSFRIIHLRTCIANGVSLYMSEAMCI